MPRSILVATNGGDSAAGAIRMAHGFAARDGSAVDVVAVQIPNLYAVGYEGIIPDVSPQWTLDAIESLRGRVRAQLESLGGPPVRELMVEVGSVAPAIAHIAAKRDAELILIGLHDRDRVDGWWARETLVRLVHLSHAPVLAVPPTASGLPRRALIGTDFTDFSIRAAQEAARMLEPGGHLDVLHVLTPFEGPLGLPGQTEWGKTYREGVEQRLGTFARELAKGGEVEVEVHTTVGDAAEQTLRLSEALGVELIALGSHGYGLLGRVLLGSVAARVVHAARCAVLVAPPSEMSSALALQLTEAELAEGLGRAGEVLSTMPRR